MLVQISVTISVLSFILSTPFFWWVIEVLPSTCDHIVTFLAFSGSVFLTFQILCFPQIDLNVCDYSRTLKTYLVVYIILIKILCCSVWCFPHLTNSLYIIVRFLEVYNWVLRNLNHIIFKSKRNRRTHKSRSL